MNNQLRFGFNSKLNKEDSDAQTLGCRANNPDICSNNMLPNVCAFASTDNICKHPSAAWKKQYYKLKEQEETEE